MKDKPILNNIFHLGPKQQQSAPIDTDLAKEIVTTQIMQIAFQMRQRDRAFDQACLLEILAADFLDKSKQCLQSETTDPFDSNAKTFALNHETKIGMM